METALLDRTAVRERTEPAELIESVRDAFLAFQRGAATMPPKTYVSLGDHSGDFRSMPAYVDAGTWEGAGVKWVNVHPENSDRHDLPTVMGLMIYSEPATALPLAVMDGTELTRWRTGAAAALATDTLAPADVTSLGIIGAGAQATAQIECLEVVRSFETLVVSDVDASAARALADRYSDRFRTRTGSIADAAHCDVLCTLTPVRDPIVPADALGSSTHVNAIGADAAGKQELDPAILEEATIVVDEREQCIHSGEINVSISEGRITESAIDATLGEVLAGTHPGRTAESGVTVFDSTGLAIQDVAAAHTVFEADTTSRGEAYDFLQLSDSR